MWEAYGNRNTHCRVKSFKRLQSYVYLFERLQSLVLQTFFAVRSDDVWADRNMHMFPIPRGNNGVSIQSMQNSNLNIIGITFSNS